MQLSGLFWILILCCIHPCSVEPAGKENISSQVSQASQVTLSKKPVTHTACMVLHIVTAGTMCGEDCSLSAGLHFIRTNFYRDASMSPLLLCVVVSTSTSLSRYQWCTADTTITTTDSLSCGGGSVFVYCAWESTALEDISRDW